MPGAVNSLASKKKSKPSSPLMKPNPLDEENLRIVRKPFEFPFFAAVVSIGNPWLTEADDVGHRHFVSDAAAPR
jgi:hypothetical protein